MRPDYAKREYFEEMIEAMEALGFILLAWVTVSDLDDSRGINDFTLAYRDSILFFNLPGKAIILQARCFECQQEDEPLFRSWDFIVYWQYTEEGFQAMMQAQGIGLSGPMNAVGGKGLTICGHQTAFNELKENTAGLAFMDNEYDEATPAQIALCLFRNVEAVIDLLDIVFDELSVSSFPPESIERYGNKIKPIFWSRFPLRRLRKLVKPGGRISGSWFSFKDPLPIWMQ